MVVRSPDRGKLEGEYLAQYPVIFGIDEVGRGCIAGPVYAACVQLDYELLNRVPDKTKALIRDSKTLSQKQRQQVIPTIKDISVLHAVSSASVREIERFGIVNATFRAMRRAIRQCQKFPDLLLLDGKYPLPRYQGKQIAVIGGDSLCYSIAAASILAKEARDGYMRSQASRYPGYDLDANVGYGTAKHLSGIDKLGICPLHRRNFAPINTIVNVNN